jgi:hypothetical protein
MSSGNMAREVFDKIEAKENTPVKLPLTQAVNGVNTVQIFINGVFINNIGVQQGLAEVTLTVPYIIDLADTIVVCYNY